MRRLIVGNSCERGLVEDVDAVRVIKKGMDSNKELTPTSSRSPPRPSGAAPACRRWPTRTSAGRAPEAQKERNVLLSKRESLRIGIPRC